MSQSEGTKTNGGTSWILPAERKKATFNVDKMTNVIDGGEEKTKRRKFLLSPMKGVDLSDRYFWGREEMLKNHVKHFVEVHEGYWDSFIPTREDVAWMLEHAVLSGALMNHYGLFLATIAGQGSAEQKFWWGFTGLQCKIIGSYAQTELGHGSNVRGLQTTATYDKESQEFILNTPTLRSMKWWPGALGKVATHTVVYAQLILDGVEYGPHPFVLQIRDENHKPLPGIELGDLGPKFGDHANDTGFMILNNVRIPREYLLCAHQEVTPEGKYVKGEVRAKNDKTHYATMMYTRGAMIKGASGYLARAVTIAIRYSCVRFQGFANTAKGQTFKAEEKQVIDYQVQNYRLLKALALTYAIKFTGKWMLSRFKDLEGTDGDPRSNQWAIQNADALPEIAATSGALKALCTYLASQSIEDCRKCCGGNGYLLASGIASLSADYLWQTTAEGDWIILMLQTAKHLMGIFKQIKTGEVTKAVSTVDYLAPFVENKKVDVDSSSFVQSHLPVAKSWKDFTDLEFLLRLFKYNTLVSVVRAGKELEENGKRMQGSSEEEIFNSTAMNQVNAVRIHCFSFMLSNFIQEIIEVEDPQCKLVLTQICALYATSLILDDSQWIGVIGSDQYQMVKTATWHLLAAIRPNAVALVDAFDIPDNILNSAIGRYDGNVYEALYEAAKKSPLNKTQVFDGYKEYLRPHLDVEFLKKGNVVPSKL